MKPTNSSVGSTMNPIVPPKMAIGRNRSAIFTLYRFITNDVRNS
jgi:hypothetical protein